MTDWLFDTCVIVDYLRDRSEAVRELTPEPSSRTGAGPGPFPGVLACIRVSISAICSAMMRLDAL